MVFEDRCFIQCIQYTGQYWTILPQDSESQHRILRYIVCVCVCVCYNLRWVDIWEPGCETQQRLRREAMSKLWHGTYYWCLHGLHIRGSSNHWLQLDAMATTLPMPEVHAGPNSLYLEPTVLQEQQPYCRATGASDPKMLLSRGGPTIGGAYRDSTS